MPNNATGGIVDGEAYLEGLIESLGTLPAELKRNLRLMEEMDGTCASLGDETMALQQAYLRRVSSKMDRLEVVSMPGSDDDGNDDGDGEPTLGVRVLDQAPGNSGASFDDGDDDASMEEDDDDDDDRPVVIPTTEELLAYVHDPGALEAIESSRTESMQRAEEKVAIATQTLELVDNLCRKLEADLTDMERNLMIVRNHHHHQTSSSSSLQTGGGGAASSSSSMLLSSSALHHGGGGGGHPGHGPHPGGGAGGIPASDHHHHHHLAHHQKRPPKKDDLAAVQEVPGSPDWILAKVLSYDPHKKVFRLSDEDTESHKVFHLPESRVVVLERMRNARAGDAVFAVYPDTTSFYRGTIAQPPRKAPPGSFAGGGLFVMVTFVDDEDAATGKTLDKAVLLKHVMPPPPGSF